MMHDPEDDEGTSLLGDVRLNQGRQVEPSPEPERRRRWLSSGSSGKLTTLRGVYIPSLTNMLSVVLYIRLGWAVGQCGLWGSLLVFLWAYAIDFLTTLSISAIVTNGEVRGGGLYFLLSRVLGPELGAAVGALFYLANICVAALNLSGFGDTLLRSFIILEGDTEAGLGSMGRKAVVVSCAVLIVSVMSTLGSRFFAAFNVLIYVLALSSVGLAVASLLFMSPNSEVGYTGASWGVLIDNLSPRFSIDDDAGEDYSFVSVANILLPLCFGFWAGAISTADLARPAHSIPRGTMLSISSGFTIYVALALLLALTVRREMLQTDFFILQSACLVPKAMAVAVLVSSVSSAMTSLSGAADILSTLVNDDLLPPLRLFRPQKRLGGATAASPRCIVVSSLLVLALVNVVDLDAIAPYTTLSFLVTYCFINMACLLLRLTDAPNFRPSFKQFNKFTAAAGGMLTLTTMLVLDAAKSGFLVLFIVLIIVYVHLQNPIKPWGHITRAVIYSQVRKYLLRLETRAEQLKFWRPSIVVLTANPRTSLNLLLFSHMLTKGGLHIVGMVVPGSPAHKAYEYKQFQKCLNALIAQLRIQAFESVTVCTDVVSGMLDIIMSAGLGSLKTNTVCIGFLERRTLPSTAHRFVGRHLGEWPSAVDAFPPARCEASSMGVKEYVDFIHGALELDKHVLVSRHFDSLDNTIAERAAQISPGTRMNVDVLLLDWSAVERDGTPWGSGSPGRRPSESGGYGTLTLCLQLGYILHSNPELTEHSKLRVISVVAEPHDVPKARADVEALLSWCRIGASVLVLTAAEYEPNIRSNPEQEVTDKSTHFITPVSPFDSSGDDLPRPSSMHYCRLLNAALKCNTLNTKCLCVMVPRPSTHSSMHERYLDGLDVLTEGLPPTFMVIGVNAVISCNI